MTSTTATQTYSSKLERLPPEVRRHVLSTLPLPELKALVRASPTFHQQYLLDRRHLLCASLENSLGSVMIDAYTVQLSTTQPMNSGAELEGFVQAYLEQIPQRHLSIAGRPTQDEAISMAKLYLNYVKPVTEDFARWALWNLPRDSDSKRDTRQQEVNLSPSEAMRMTRTVYRFELISQLVHPPIGWQRNKRVFRERVMEDMFEAIEPWEVEEFACFWKYMKSVYVKIFQDIRWELHPDNPRFDDQGRPPTPDGAFDLDMEQDEFLEGTILCGLDLLHKVLFKVGGHEELVLTMQDNILRCSIMISDSYGVLGSTTQELRRTRNPTARDWMLERREPISFRGDGEPDAPPLGWIIIWNGTYSNLYGSFTSSALQDWGYVFWDAATIDRLGVRDCIKRQWNEEWPSDPREDLLQIGQQ